MSQDDVMHHICSRCGLPGGPGAELDHCPDGSYSHDWGSCIALLKVNNVRLREALLTSPCPSALQDDDGTVQCCVSGGHCGCDNAGALGK